jgi:hypothetical protein
MTRLGLEKGEEWRLPKFLHSWRLHLPGWLAKGEALTVVALPPPYFLEVHVQLFRYFGSGSGIIIEVVHQL